MTQNVVTYTIAVDIDNADGKLLPYLTANTQFEVGRRKGVLLVPNAALRWSPRPGQIAPDLRQGSHDRTSRRDHGPNSTGVRTTVWIGEGKFVRPVPVNAGLTDGAFTEVEGKGLTEGLRVVIGEGMREAEAAPTADRNPFTPQLPFRGQRQGQGPGQSQDQQGQGNQDQPAPSSGHGR